jgi:hypothetical protein
MVSIYVLKLAKNKYYVGRTHEPKFRIDKHFDYKGSAWTRLYRPREVLQLIPDCDYWDEDKYTLIAMSTYGIDNVRGGTFSTLEIEPATVSVIKQMIMGAQDKCYNCGEIGHYIQNCNVIWACNTCDEEFSNKSSYETHEHNCLWKNKCIICGRGSHNRTTCYARTHINGNTLK